MVIFLESPWPAIGIGALLLLPLTIRFLQARQVKVLAGMILVVGLTAAMVYMERVVITDKEAVENILYDAGAAVEANNYTEAVKHVSSTTPRLKYRVDNVRKYRIDSIRVGRDLEIHVDPEQDPPHAKADFTVTARGPWGMYEGHWTVQFRKEEDANEERVRGWRVYQVIDNRR